MELRDLDKANDLSRKLFTIRGVIDAWSQLIPHGPHAFGADIQVVDTKAWLAMRAASVKLLEEQHERAAAELAAL